MTSTEDWIDIGAVGDVPLRGSRLINTVAGPIALFRTADGTFFAVDDRCPHGKGPLHQGIVHDHGVTCPLHNLVIDLKTGEAKGPEAFCVTTFPVREEAGRILFDVSALRQAEVA